MQPSYLHVNTIPPLHSCLFIPSLVPKCSSISSLPFYHPFHHPSMSLDVEQKKRNPQWAVDVTNPHRTGRVASNQTRLYLFAQNLTFAGVKWNAQKDKGITESHWTEWSTTEGRERKRRIKIPNGVTLKHNCLLKNQHVSFPLTYFVHHFYLYGNLGSWRNRTTQSRTCWNVHRHTTEGYGGDRSAQVMEE